MESDGVIWFQRLFARHSNNSIQSIGEWIIIKESYEQGARESPHIGRIFSLQIEPAPIRTGLQAQIWTLQS